LEWLLFWGPWSPWKGPYALKDEFKDPDKLPMIGKFFKFIFFGYFLLQSKNYC